MKLTMEKYTPKTLPFTLAKPVASKASCSVVDLFCGVGGMTHGFVLEGFDVVAGIDSDSSCGYAYEHNNGARFIHARLENFDKNDIRSLYPDGHVKILVGCAPCQPFSSYTKKKSNKNESWKLLQTFSDIIDFVEPDIVSMENVPDLKTFKKGTVYSKFMKRLAKNYFVSSHIVYCPDYGIPQMRTRLVVLASRYGWIELLEGTHTPDRYRNVQDVIGHLEPIEAGQTSNHDPLHKARGLSKLNLQRIMQSVPGGTWADWNDELIAACHKKPSGKTYKSVYGRMGWRDPAPTITAQFYGYGSGRFGHPEQHRALSLREGALLQTFPPHYQFVEPDGHYVFERVGLHIGNAVPVDLGRVIAQSIENHLGG